MKDFTARKPALAAALTKEQRAIDELTKSHLTLGPPVVYVPVNSASHYWCPRAYVKRPKGDETQCLEVDEISFAESAIDQGRIAEGGLVLDDHGQAEQIEAARKTGE